MKRANRTLLVIGAGLTVLALLTACGGDDTTSSVTLPPLTTRADGNTQSNATTTAGSSATTTRAGSSSATTVAARGAVDPCKVVTKAEADALARTTLQDGILVAGEDSSCTYTGPTSGPTAQVEVYVGAGAKKFYDIDVDLKHDFTNVPGIGDEAHLEDFTIFARKGTTWLAIRLVRLDDADQYNEPLKALARTAIGRL